MNKKIDKNCFLELKKIKKKLYLSNEEIATRKASNIAINLLQKKMPFLKIINQCWFVWILSTPFELY